MFGSPLTKIGHMRVRGQLQSSAGHEILVMARILRIGIVGGCGKIAKLQKLSVCQKAGTAEASIGTSNMLLDCLYNSRNEYLWNLSRIWTLQRLIIISLEPSFHLSCRFLVYLRIHCSGPSPKIPKPQTEYLGQGVEHQTSTNNPNLGLRSCLLFNFPWTTVCALGFIQCRV